MAYAPMPQFVSIHGPKIGCNDLPMSTITQVLQSEPVQRLLHRQNVYLQSPVASGSQLSDIPSAKSSSWSRSNGTLIESKSSKTPELSVIPIMGMPASVSQVPVIEDKHLLPSKYEGKSEVALVPIKRRRRRCGHSEPCESLVCDVAIQELASNDSVYPLIAVNIDSSEIDAPVSKHCKSNDCDALSIDHDRCRRAIIRCHRCDVTQTCDICLVVLKTRKSQVNHKNCKMRIEYRHNRTSRGQIMRDRMRQREVQILEAARSNKKDYTDPLTGHDLAMESLQNNSELIVIPKTSVPLQQHPTIRITSVSGAALTPSTKTPENYQQFLPRFPVIYPQQGMRLTPEHQANLLGNPGSPNIPSSSSTPRNSYITITRMPATNFIKPVNISNLLKSPPQTNPTPTTQYNPFLVPMCVVPIAGLKTKPSLQHHTQGLPKYCLVPESSAKTSPAYTAAQFKLISPQPAEQIKVEPDIREDSSNDARKGELLKRLIPGTRRGRRKKVGPKKGAKSFECTFCFKKFSTDWYFKLHIAKHKGEIKFTCKYCKKPFMHLYNMTKHVVTMHKTEIATESSSENDNDENFDEYEQSMSCINCKTTFESTDEMEKHPCRIFCLLCDARLLDGDLMIHLKVKHTLPDVEAVNEYERQKRQSGIAIKGGRPRLSQEISNEETTANSLKEDKRENGLSKRRRSSVVSNESKLSRRKDSSDTEEIDTILYSNSENGGDDDEQTLCTETGFFYPTSYEPETILSEY